MFSVDQQLVTNRIQRFFEALAQKHNIEWDGEILNSSESMVMGLHTPRVDGELFLVLGFHLTY